MSHFVTSEDLSSETLTFLLELAATFKKAPPGPLLQGKILASCFFEPSTRTRLSFEAAMIRLGGSVIGFANGNESSTAKGETLRDSLKVVQNYADVVVLRHPVEGAARWAAENITTPVINAGDGGNQHPSQTLLDLFTIQECYGTLKNLSIAIAGDLKFGRTIHSLIRSLLPFKPRFYFMAVQDLELSEHYHDLLHQNNVRYSYHQKLEEVIPKADILYMTRIQKERFINPLLFERVESTYCLKPQHLERAKPNLKILHPLPRTSELPTTIDETPYAYYFQQAENGLYVRQALLSYILQPQTAEVIC